MERMRGQCLAQRWFGLAPEAKQKTFGQLKNMIDEMRNLLPPVTGAISNVDGGTLYDMRLPRDPSNANGRFGPFQSVQDFHRYLRSAFEAHSDHVADVSQLIHWQDYQDPKTKFTHGDLSSLNVLVNGDQVTAIIDWETAGWYPEYWEYTTACQVNPRNPWWRDELDKFLEPFPEASEMDKIRLKYFGDT
ncbi:hypothetical protein LTS18_009541 [Coniosporium uncinatum]|uniref:Uncharacterized protein n=1 Tax=Coniosporium uncinatum TaxID=93489 RepID=A0ACC3DM88_9PEZI|nr:hypothetical protein LTS18_009541 [Coniosporium uncinatum]